MGATAAYLGGGFLLGKAAEGKLSSKPATQKTEYFDPQRLSEIMRIMQERGTSMISNQQVSPEMQAFRKTGLSEREQEALEQELLAIEKGAIGAEQTIEQSTREAAEARGLGASRGAIAEEAARLANIPMMQAQQRSQVLGRAGAMQRQGLLAERQRKLLELQMGYDVLGQAGNIAGTGRQVYTPGQKGLAGLIGGAAGAYFGGPQGAMMGYQLGSQF